MPIRQGGILTSRASTWPRDHFCRSTMAPRASWPTTWNEFLPISMPITAIALSNFWDMACSLSLAPLPSILLLVEQEHGRTIPLADMRKPWGCSWSVHQIAASVLSILILYSYHQLEHGRLMQIQLRLSEETCGVL